MVALTLPKNSKVGQGKTWRKHTLARLSPDGKVKLTYRPVHTETTLPLAEGGIDPKKIAPKARVY